MAKINTLNTLLLLGSQEDMYIEITFHKNVFGLPSVALLFGPQIMTSLI